MTPPATPPDENARQWMLMRDQLKTRRGFMLAYAKELSAIWHTSRHKRGLKMKAYEATERLYQEIVGEGRKYPDVENFRVALCRHCKSPSVKD